MNLAMLDALELADALTASPAGDATAAVRAYEARMQERTSDEIGACLAIGRQVYGFDLDFSAPASGSLAA